MRTKPAPPLKPSSRPLWDALAELLWRYAGDADADVVAQLAAVHELVIARATGGRRRG